MLAFVLLIVVGFIFTFWLSGIRILRPTQRGLVETFGKYSRFAMPGFNWIIPIAQDLIEVDITENMVESGKREMITNDNLNATIDALIFYKVKSDEESVKNSEYNVQAYEDQIIAITKTALRNIIGTMTLKEANSERNKINVDLLTMLSKETATWGIEVVRAELKEIDPPKDVQETMNMIVKALNEKTAAVDFATAAETHADGVKRSKIKEAEGRKQAQILEAEGQSDAAVKIANGRAQAIQIENEAADKYFKGNAITLRKIEAVERTFKDGSKIIMPQGQNMITTIDGLLNN